MSRERDALWDDMLLKMKKGIESIEAVTEAHEKLKEYDQKKEKKNEHR